MYAREQAVACAAEQERHQLLVQQCRMHLRLMKFSRHVSLPMSDLGLSDAKQDVVVHPVLFAPTAHTAAGSVHAGRPAANDDDFDQLTELFEQFDEYLRQSDR